MADDRSYIKVHDDIEDHPKIVPLSDAAFRLLVTSWGWCFRYNTDGRMPAAVWARRGTAKARAELTKSQLAVPTGEEVEFHDYLEHQRSAAQRAAAREQRRSAGKAGGLAKGKRTASEPLTESLSETQAELEKEVEENSSSKSSCTPARADVDGLCSYFLAAIAANGCKGSITEKWRTAARLLIDKDGREPHEIRAVIDWATQDAFWQPNILSVPTLRDKYDQLRLGMQNGRGRKPISNGIASHPDEAYLRPGVFSRSTA